jgi:hypothetical protein
VVLGSSVACSASVAVAAGVSLRMRRALTVCEQPSRAHGPSHVTRPGADVASVV